MSINVLVIQGHPVIFSGRRCEKILVNTRPRFTSVHCNLEEAIQLDLTLDALYRQVCRIFRIVSVPLAVLAWIWFIAPTTGLAGTDSEGPPRPEAQILERQRPLPQRSGQATVGREITVYADPAHLVRERNRGGRPWASV